MANQKHESLGKRWRDRIKASQVINVLIDNAEGKIELDRTRAMVCLRLVDKILPSLQAVSVEQTVKHIGLSRHDLDARLIALGENPQEVWKSLGNQQVIGHKVGDQSVIEHEPVDTNSDTGTQTHES